MDHRGLKIELYVNPQAPLNNFYCDAAQRSVLAIIASCAKPSFLTAIRRLSPENGGKSIGIVTCDTQMRPKREKMSMGYRGQVCARDGHRSVSEGNSSSFILFK